MSKPRTAADRGALVEPMIRETHLVLAERGYAVSPSRVVRMVRAYLRQTEWDAPSIARWRNQLDSADRQVVEAIQTAQRSPRIRVILSGLPTLGRRR